MTILQNKPPSLISLQIIGPFEEPSFHYRFILRIRFRTNAVTHFLTNYFPIFNFENDLKIYTSSILNSDVTQNVNILSLSTFSWWENQDYYEIGCRITISYQNLFILFYTNKIYDIFWDRKYFVNKITNDTLLN